MYCHQCGAANPENAQACARCGTAFDNPYSATSIGDGPPSHVPNYLVFSILVTLCCCLPFGIPAIVFSAQVNPKLANGDYEGAVQSSNSAKTWCWVSFALGLVGQGLYAAMIAFRVFSDMKPFR